MVAGRLDLWSGRLQAAIVHLTLAGNGLDVPPEAWRQLGWAHYHRNDFAAAADAFERSGAARAMVAKLRSFKTRPYALDGGLPVVLPFVQTDPLPVVRLSLAGRDVYALIDTGGGELILDPGVASEAGVEIFGSEMGTFGGGAKASYQHRQAGRGRPRRHPAARRACARSPYQAVLRRHGAQVQRVSIPDTVMTAGCAGVAPFAIDELALGPLVERRLTGIFGPFPEGLGREVGCAGLISHGFLRRFRWTLDFDDYVFYLERPEA